MELRLDNVVFRLGLAPSIRSARQLVGHGHVRVNDKKVDISSIVLNVGDRVTLTDKGAQNQIVLRAKQSPRLEIPDFLRKDEAGGTDTGIVQNIPGTEHVPFSFDAGLFTEYYAARNV